MSKQSLFFLAFLISTITSSCGAANATSIIPTATPQKTTAPLTTFTPSCVSPKPTQADIDRVLTFSGDLFKDWESNNTSSDNHAAISWVNNTEGAAAYLEALIFPCGYEDLDLNKYFNEENWVNVFQNYQSHTQLGSMCQTNAGLRLYEFSLDNQGYPYNARYWAKNDTDTRVIGVMLIFPSSSMSLMDEYASKLFPQLPNCS